MVDSLVGVLAATMVALSAYGKADLKAALSVWNSVEMKVLNWVGMKAAAWVEL
jgi:hypothetical protein